MKKRTQYFSIIVLFILSGVGGFLFSLYNHPSLDDAKIYHSPISFIKQLEGDKDSGRKIFNEFCASCHAVNPVISVNAPRINDKKRWDTYRKLGVPTLLLMTIQGQGAMPARGGCFECSDEQLRETIRYIVQANDM